MSGHSKWSTIKRKKGKSDQARAKIFTKIGREIAVAVKNGGVDPNSNSRLRDMITKAKAANMPNDNISRSIKKAGGELNSINYETIIYEGYGVGGIAVLVECLTDNKNRTAGNVRHTFDKYGGSMGTTGCVSYLFESKGVIAIEKKADMDDDEIMMTCIDCGADDFNAADDEYEILTSSADFSAVREQLETKNFTFTRSEIENIPINYISIEGDNLDRFCHMLEIFEEDDDVQNVYHNADLPEDIEEE